MGGIFNTVNLHLYHYAGNNPVKYVDPDGRQSVYLPGGGTVFNGVNPGMNYNMETYAKNSETIGDFVEGITSKPQPLGILIDKIFLGGAWEKKATGFYFKVQMTFIKTMSDFKSSGVFDQNKDGIYSDEEVSYFTKAVNDTMTFNYTDQKLLGPYKNSVEIPQLDEYDAKRYLNDLNDDMYDFPKKMEDN